MSRTLEPTRAPRRRSRDLGPKAGERRGKTAILNFFDFSATFPFVNGAPIPFLDVFSIFPFFSRDAPFPTSRRNGRDDFNGSTFPTSPVVSSRKKETRSFLRNFALSVKESVRIVAAIVRRPLLRTLRLFRYSKSLGLMLTLIMLYIMLNQSSTGVYSTKITSFGSIKIRCDGSRSISFCLI